MTVEHSNTENTTALRIYYCGREQCAPGHFWGPAIRPHYLLHVVLHGKGEFFYQEKKYELSAGDAFLIEPMQTHYYQADKEEPWEYAWVGFDGSLRGRGSLLHNFPIFPCLYHGLCSVYSAHDPAECPVFCSRKESTGTGICFSPATLLYDPSGHFRLK